MPELKSKKPKKPAKRFNQSLRRSYPCVPGESCRLKNHFRGALFEVVGYVDDLAKGDPERYVWASPEAIAKKCKFVDGPNKGKNYQKRIVEYALQLLRRIHVISAPLWRKRYTPNGFLVERKGFIVAPHDCLCKIDDDGKQCSFHGPLPTGIWEPDFINETYVQNAGWKRTKTGPLFWLKYSSSAVECAVECAGGCAERCAGRCAGRCAVDVSAQPEDSTTVKPENAPLTDLPGVTGQAVAPAGTDVKKLPSQTDQPSGKANPNTKIKSITSSQSALRAGHDLTDQKQRQTIGQQFTTKVSMEEITDGEWEQRMDGVSTDQRADDEINNNALLKICDGVIKERSNHTYLGRKSHGDIMAEAMVRYSKQYSEQTPPYWYAIVKKLRAKDFIARDIAAERAYLAKPFATYLMEDLLLKLSLIRRSDLYTYDGRDGCWDWIKNSGEPERMNKEELAVLLASHVLELPPMLKALHEKLNPVTA